MNVQESVSVHVCEEGCTCKGCGGECVRPTANG